MHSPEQTVDRMTIKPWAVTVEGYPDAAIYYTRTRGQAMADAWRCDAFGAISFKDFLKIAKCRKADLPHSQFGDAITVEGKPAFYIDRNRAYVRVQMQDMDRVSNVHPSDILPEGYRPEAYRALLEKQPCPK
jgi:hypothetical protein